MPLKVMIVGSGIAGPALAAHLTRLGCKVKIVERSRGLRDYGQQIDIRTKAGMKAMRQLGIEKAVREKIVHEPGAEFLDVMGHRKAYFGAQEGDMTRQSLTAEIEIMRGDLCRILYDATAAETTYEFGRSVESLTQDEDGVSVRFADGKVEKADLLVGADGQHSKIRSLMLDPGASDPFKPINVAVTWYSIPAQPGDSNVANFCLLPGGRCVMTRKEAVDTLHVYIFASTKKMTDDHPLLQAVRYGDHQQQKRAWGEHCKGVNARVDRYIAGMNTPEARDWTTAELGQVKLDQLYNGRVVLIGDAAQCPTPASGKGTTAALVNAHVLAGEIARHCTSKLLANQNGDRPTTIRDGLQAAFLGYNEKIQPFVRETQNLGPGVPDLFMPHSGWGVAVANIVISLSAKLRVLELLNKISAGDKSLWQLPDYPELGPAPA